ncbi:MAG: alpha/beta hydrolase [Mycobacteriaceae bacterium]
MEKSRVAIVLAIILTAGICLVAAPASAFPLSSLLRQVEPQSDGSVVAQVFSPAMDKEISVQILLPKHRDVKRPTLYLLDGIDAQENFSGWVRRTDVVDFFADKNVNVVLPMGGRSSFYTDWRTDDNAFGRYQWETFLTKELPAVIDSDFNGNGTNAIAGLSMGAHAALLLTERHPELYQGVASYSGCMSTSMPGGPEIVRVIVGSQGGDAVRMWGENWDPSWAEHDPMLHAEALRGKRIFLSSGSGIPGPYDFEYGPGYAAAGGISIFDLTSAGMALEAGTKYCTTQFQSRLADLGIPVTVSYSPDGTHFWPYWQDELHNSWPMLAESLGL